jgi:hypothetical protein
LVRDVLWCGRSVKSKNGISCGRYYSYPGISNGTLMSELHTPLVDMTYVHVYILLEQLALVL